MIVITPREEGVLADAITTYGSPAQKRKAIEECAELITALSRGADGRSTQSDIIDEIADVIIIANQLSRMYSEEAVRATVKYKIERLEKRMQEGGDDEE